MTRRHVETNLPKTWTFLVKRAKAVAKKYSRPESYELLFLKRL